MIMKWKIKLPGGLWQKLPGSIWLAVAYRIGIALFFALLGRHLWRLGIELFDKVFFTLFWLLLFNLFLGFGQEENRIRCSWAFLARPEWLLGMTILLLLYGLFRIVPLLKKVPLLWM